MRFLKFKVCHCALLNHSFMKIRIFSDSAYFKTDKKNHAGPNTDYLPLNVLLEPFLEIKTKLKQA